LLVILFLVLYFAGIGCYGNPKNGLAVIFCMGFGIFFVTGIVFSFAFNDATKVRVVGRGALFPFLPLILKSLFADTSGSWGRPPVKCWVFGRARSNTSDLGQHVEKPFQLIRYWAILSGFAFQLS
jgi:hypothetical protein